MISFSFLIKVISSEVVREVEARMNRAHNPPNLLALPTTASFVHRQPRVSQVVCPLPTVKEANRPGTINITVCLSGISMNYEHTFDSILNNQCWEIIAIPY